MSTPSLDCGDCPACNEPLKIEPDARMRTCFALVCDNPTCKDGGGSWLAPEILVQKWKDQMRGGPATNEEPSTEN